MMIEFRTIRRVLVDNTPSAVSIVLQLRMDTGDVHVLFEELRIRPLTTAYHRTVDTLNTDVQIGIIERQGRNAMRNRSSLITPRGKGTHTITDRNGT